MPKKCLTYREFGELMGVSTHRAWCLCNRTQQRESRQKWRTENYAKDRAQDNARKRQINAKRYPRLLMKKVVYRSIDRAKLTGLVSPVALLGCSMRELASHIESQFRDGMNWGNYGPKGWHVDHRKPLAAFDFTDPADVAEAFHYSNLQPLWFWQNIAKGGRIVD